MLRFKIGPFLKAMQNLTHVEGTIGIASWEERGQPTPPEIRSQVDQFLKDLREACAELPLPLSIDRQIERMQGSLTYDDNTDRLVTIRLLGELRKNITVELVDQVFFLVPRARRTWYVDKDQAVFGSTIAKAFPESTPELSEAGRCFAFGRWTACVFHLMRALELALHRWALELGVSQFSAIELENWKNILDAAEKRVRTLEQMPKSPSKDAELQYYGETLGHFRSVKDAWRNHVAHARTTYNEGQATSIMAHVREFMTLLATRP